jgi:hypothetical protein
VAQTFFETHHEFLTLLKGASQGIANIMQFSLYPKCILYKKHDYKTTRKEEILKANLVVIADKHVRI